MPQNIVTRCADTLEEDWPIHEEGSDIDKPLAVDAVVSNPPYSQHWDPTNKEMDARFAQYGLAPKTKADYAFLLHELHHLKSDGILTIVLPHDVLFRGKAPKRFDKDGNLLPIEEREEGQAEGQIRANLIEKNNIDAIIGLPANIFFGTGIPTLIMVLKKNRGDEGVLIIDASKGFIKDGKQNKLRASDVKKIADTYRERKNIPGYSRVVSRDEIRRNEYNLNIPRYVDSSEAAVKYDIYSTMFGGIPNTEISDLGAYWTAFPTLQQDIFAAEADKPYSSVKVENVLDTILANADVKAFKANFATAFADFQTMLHQRLVNHVEDVKELEENDNISADIFRRIAPLPLVDKYAAYQILTDHWQDIMGDIEIIQTEGMGACNVVEPKYKMVKDKNGVEQEVPDGEKGRIMPFDLVQHVYFQTELDDLTAISERIEAINGEVDAIKDDFNDDEQETYLDAEKDGALDKNKIKADAKPKADVEPDTKDKLKAIVALWDEQSKAKKALSKKTLELLAKTKEKIETLDMHEISALLDKKWIEPVTTAISAMPDAVIATLADAVQSLAEKYSVTYHDIERDLASSKQTLADLVSQLTGDEFAIKGLTELIKG